MEVAIIGPDGGDAIQLGPCVCGSWRTAARPTTAWAWARSRFRPTPTDRPSTATPVTTKAFTWSPGTASFTVGDTTYEAPAGTLVMVPPGAPHTFANPGDEPAVLLNTFTPDLYVQYFRDLRDMIAAGQPFTPEATVEVMARYATVPATDYAD